MKTTMALVAAGLLAACGFDCKVKEQTVHVASCEDLQAKYDEEKAHLDPPPDNAVLDDLDTCGAANGCVVKP